MRSPTTGGVTVEPEVGATVSDEVFVVVGAGVVSLSDLPPAMGNSAQVTGQSSRASAKLERESTSEPLSTTSVRRPVSSSRLSRRVSKRGDSFFCEAVLLSGRAQVHVDLTMRESLPVLAPGPARGDDSVAVMKFKVFDITTGGHGHVEMHFRAACDAASRACVTLLSRLRGTGVDDASALAASYAPEVDAVLAMCGDVRLGAAEWPVLRALLVNATPARDAVLTEVCAQLECPLDGVG